ncbi:MAG TPA: CsbD family protein [Vicinamibacteria bacterium]
MNEDILKGQWKQLQGKARQQWGKLTDDDLSLIKGNRDILLGKIQERYGRTREEAMKDIDTWLQGEGAR